MAEDTPMDYFPLPIIREQQRDALNFFYESVLQGYNDIVVNAPTGTGKSPFGLAACFWANSVSLKGYKSGGYYLVTQKTLQDQLENEFRKFLPRFNNRAASIRSANEYPCQKYTTCGMGGKMTGATRCQNRVEGGCPYKIAKNAFEFAIAGITNYPYFFTEHVHINMLEPRNLLVLDEAHTLERQITSFVEVCVDKTSLDTWAPLLKPVKRMPSIEEFCEWLLKVYLKVLIERQKMLYENIVMGGHRGKAQIDEHARLENHIGRTLMAAQEMTRNPEDWVYWQEKNEDGLTSTAKPLSAVPFTPQLLNEMSDTRLYMSAYMGPKDVFCRSLGLNPKRTAWLELDSAFPAENRPIHVVPVGSMGRQFLDSTTPHLLEMCSTVIEAHKEEKGIIHCVSYKLGIDIFNHLRSRGQGHRILFPRKAEERASLLVQHRRTKTPTVIISPSMGEGYSFDDDLARFQIIAKVNWPYLGDRQIEAKMKMDQDWYTLQTAMSIIQACGRIVRSATDRGVSYILDADFLRLHEQNNRFFPKWFQDAVKFH